jgi:CHAD domain-containing protein
VNIVNIDVVVYVDDTHVFAAERNAVLDVLSPYLIERTSTREAAVMVVRSDDFTEILLNFTSDPEEVKASIHDLKQRKPNPSESMLLERNADQQKQEARRRGGNDVMNAMRGYATTLKRDTTRSLGALT